MSCKQFQKLRGKSFGTDILKRGRRLLLHERGKEKEVHAHISHTVDMDLYQTGWGGCGGKWMGKG